MTKNEIARYVDVDCDEHLKELIIEKLSQETIELSEQYIHAYAKEFVKGYYEGFAEAVMNSARSYIAAGLDREFVISTLELTDEQIAEL